MKKSYKDLLKIKSPVMLVVSYQGEPDRMRILQPNGHCEWSSLNNPNDLQFDESCFLPPVTNLERTLSNMSNYDGSIREIIEVIKL